MFRKRKNPTPGFRMAPPFHPMSGEYASLSVGGVSAHSAIVQVAKEDTEDNYVTCRGFDPRISKFIDYDPEDPNKPGIPVAKPYGKRHPGVYIVGEVYQAFLPLQSTNPSPSDVEWRVGQNPGYAVDGGGHPQSLNEKIDSLYTLEGKLINYMLVDDGALDAIIAFTCLTDRTREVDVNGLNFGRSTVLITDKVGIAGNAIGETVTAIFGDKRWLETVAGCQGMAIYQYDAKRAEEIELDDPWFWIVFECQGLTAGFWCETQEDRTAGQLEAPVQDVLVEVVQQTGHANDDFPRENWHTPANPGSCSGSAVWIREMTGGSWTNAQPCPDGCMSKQDPNELELDPLDTTFSSPCVSDGPPDEVEIKVRFLAGTFPRMRTGAMCYVMLDNDITNTTDNTTDNTTIRYYVVYSQELVDEISGTLPQDVCKANFAVTAVNNDSPWPHNQPLSTFPLTIKNTRHAGVTGSSWSATWSDASQAYVCVDVEKVAVTVPIFLESSYDQQTGCITIGGSTQKVYVERCDDTLTPFKLFQYRPELRKFVDKLEYEEGHAQGNCTGNAGWTRSSYTIPGGSWTEIDSCPDGCMSKQDPNELDLAPEVVTFSSPCVRRECDSVLRLKWIEQYVFTLCAPGAPVTSGADEIQLETKDVVVDFSDTDGCLSSVYSQIIVFGQCGDNFNGDPILCVKRFECSSSPSSTPSASSTPSSSSSSSWSSTPSPSPDPCIGGECTYIWVEEDPDEPGEWQTFADTCIEVFADYQGCVCADPPEPDGDEYPGQLAWVSCGER